ncbi:MAG: hypothetical protein LiPW31_98, partial [Microgenomates group bacterium LiPW_31]
WFKIPYIPGFNHLSERIFWIFNLGNNLYPAWSFFLLENKRSLLLRNKTGKEIIGKIDGEEK